MTNEAETNEDEFINVNVAAVVAPVVSVELGSGHLDGDDPETGTETRIVLIYGGEDQASHFAVLEAVLIGAMMGNVPAVALDYDQAVSIRDRITELLAEVEAEVPVLSE